MVLRQCLQLFYSLLDVRHGEDEQTLLLASLAALTAALPSQLNWGPTPASCDYGDIPPVLANDELVLLAKHAAMQQARSRRRRRASVDDAASDIGERSAAASTAARGVAAAASASDDDEPQVIELPPDRVWVPLPQALYAAAKLLHKAPKHDIAATLLKIHSRSVVATAKTSASASGDGIDGAGAHMMSPQVAAVASKHLRGLGGHEPLAAMLNGKSAGAAQQRVGAAGDTASYDVAASSDRCIDLFVWLRVLVLAYREEQARRRATIRLMFTVAIEAAEKETAAVAAAAGSASATAGGAPLPATRGGAVPSVAAVASAQAVAATAAMTTDAAAALASRARRGVTARQLATIVQLIMPSYPRALSAVLYHDAFVFGSGIVDYDSFMAAAEHRQLFSHCLRLPPLMSGSDRSTPTLTPAQCTQLTYLVIERAHCLERDLAPWLAQLPPGESRWRVCLPLAADSKHTYPALRSLSLARMRIACADCRLGEARPRVAQAAASGDR